MSGYKCLHEGCGRDAAAISVAGKLGPFCWPHEHRREREWAWCWQKGCGRWRTTSEDADKEARWCSHHGGEDYLRGSHEEYRRLRQAGHSHADIKSGNTDF